MKEKFRHAKLRFGIVFILTFFIISLTGCSKGKDQESSEIFKELPPERDLLVSENENSQENKEVFESSEIIFRKPEDASPKESISKEEKKQEETKTSEETSQKSEAPTSESPKEKTIEHSEVIGVWISYLDFKNLLEDKDENQAINAINTAFKKLKEDGFNTVYLQIRPFSDAIYSSDLYPFSHVLNSEKIQGKDPGYDPLELFITQGKEIGISVQGWINPFRISYDNHPKSLATTNILYNENMSEKDFIILGNNKYINPGSPYGQQMVINGVLEVIKNYSLDGIQFDDYFYPSSESGVDSVYYNEYIDSGGKLDLDSWRRENINTLIRNTNNAIKGCNNEIIFGVSPDASIERNYTIHYADVKHWVENGYVDYLLPQVYFGFNHQTLPFEKTTLDWQEIVDGSKTKLIIGLAPYKVGLLDNWAGDNGKNEWINSENLLLNKYNTAKSLPSYGGVCFFRYDSIYNPDVNLKSQIETEISNFADGIK